MSAMKPMLASNHEDELLEQQFPMYCSPKIDGFRCFNDGGEALTRSRKPQPNQAIRSVLSHHKFSGLDGELVVGDIKDPHVFQKSSGDLRRKEGEPDWSWHIFDDFTNQYDSFFARLERLRERVAALNEAGYDNIYVVEQRLIHDMEGLAAYEQDCLALGFEGVMAKRANGWYKFGRSTAKEGLCIKIKRYDYDEAEIVDSTELMHNENEAFEDELGRTARTSHQENLVQSGMLGAYTCRNERLWPGVTFGVSASSMTHEEKRAAWEGREGKKGQIIRFKHFSHGSKDRPRHGVFDCELPHWGASHE